MMYLKTIFIVLSLVIRINANPLSGDEGAIPRTEVLETVSSNSVTGASSTEESIKFNGTNLCMTKGCIKAAALVLDLIDENVNPCENFYEFACGRFMRNTFIPDDKIAVMSFVQVQDNVLSQLRSVLNERSMPNESKPFRLAKTFNTACMDEETLERKGKRIKHFELNFHLNKFDFLQE